MEASSDENPPHQDQQPPPPPPPPPPHEERQHESPPQRETQPRSRTSRASGGSARAPRQQRRRSTRGPPAGGATSPSRADKKRTRIMSVEENQLESFGPGYGLTPLKIVVEAEQDVMAQVSAFVRQGTQSASILSASGVISRATIRQSRESSDDADYEGPFQLLSLAGNLVLNVDDCISISMSGATDEPALVGFVSGPLMAASPVTVVLGMYSDAPPTTHAPNNSGVAGTGPAPLAEDENASG